MRLRTGGRRTTADDGWESGRWGRDWCASGIRTTTCDLGSRRAGFASSRLDECKISLLNRSTIRIRQESQLADSTRAVSIWAASIWAAPTGALHHSPAADADGHDADPHIRRSHACDDAERKIEALPYPVNDSSRCAMELMDVPRARHNSKPTDDFT
jgi:hypothetical protein